VLREAADILWRGLRLRCPCCGYGRLFRSAFHMHVRCSACGERFEREPGQWFGAVYINLGLTLGTVVLGVVLTRALTSLTTSHQAIIWTPFAALAPFLFHRLSQGLWVSIIFLGEGLYIAWPHR
jgi:uncharacterized protein (DUF983 family)